jgi:pseudaminic acid cytidylyltransferase
MLELNVAIIPARGGSKRIPGKNIKKFAGKPIIYYSIEAAQQCRLFYRIIVSTDSDRIAEIACQAGAEIPFMRPASLSDDCTPTASVLEHAIDWLEANGEQINYFCCIYPTAPFIRPEDLKNAFGILRREKASEVFPVTTFDFCIFRGLKAKEDDRYEMFWPENELVRSQDLPEALHDAGQFYMFDCKAFLERQKIWDPYARLLKIPRYLVQDIDTVEDWEMAEVNYENCKKLGLLGAFV